MATAEIHTQLLAALAKSGWSIPELLEKSGLEIDRTGLWRKMHGQTPFSVEEVGALVHTFNDHGVQLVIAWPRRPKKKVA